MNCLIRLFDACPACKSEWAFDYTGRIYSCTATVGKEDEALGTFYPEVKKNEQLIHQWAFRDVTSIEECKNCAIQLTCGGGCGSVAKNKKRICLVARLSSGERVARDRIQSVFWGDDE